ncbi:MAG: hypothetical protein EMLJLAPB_00145 [Candidatus Argoarchaeum ethanivorans]|uniref:Uncharacterized protein n=1 Tax=Candidatus Argoarchaeum ethanivorans TaxID=2608793 RepID=A0A811T757_9EURY|nr:MAG: hypothetical protein EMLJLAPB_00145 [Candidatus Argoarchaeum ethanivorans]
MIVNSTSWFVGHYHLMGSTGTGKMKNVRSLFENCRIRKKIKKIKNGCTVYIKIVILLQLTAMPVAP